MPTRKEKSKKNKKAWAERCFIPRPAGRDFNMLWDYLYGMPRQEILSKYKVDNRVFLRVRRDYRIWCANMAAGIDAEMARQMAFRMILGHDEYKSMLDDVQELSIGEKKETETEPEE